ncbi:unnamed protein product [Soboliphyme baturini]|uniref:pyridoxal 5'-phosphate synthase n=1 Tax=Soboliphyme baturini TaxID=241478 RepID=A0A183IZF3_9BILA|nr:unnamed protein product [Soboliphyme baturini]
MVQMRSYGPDGYRFFTYSNSRKGKELAGNECACMLFYWPAVHRQVIIEGVARKLPRQITEEFWKRRPDNLQATVCATAQSEVIPNRQVLERKKAEILKTYTAAGAPIPLPPNW